MSRFSTIFTPQLFPTNKTNVEWKAWTIALDLVQIWFFFLFFFSMLDDDITKFSIKKPNVATFGVTQGKQNKLYKNEPIFGTWTVIIFDWMILLRIFVFRDHLKGHFWNSQQPIIVYEVSWLNNVCLYHVHYMPYYLWRKNRSKGSIIFEPEPGSKSRRSYSGS